MWIVRDCKPRPRGLRNITLYERKYRTGAGDNYTIYLTDHPNGRPG